MQGLGEVGCQVMYLPFDSLFVVTTPTQLQPQHNQNLGLTWKWVCTTLQPTTPPASLPKLVNFHHNKPHINIKINYYNNKININDDNNEKINSNKMNKNKTTTKPNTSK